MTGERTAQPGAPSYGFDPVAPRYDRTRGGTDRGRRVAAVLDQALRTDTPVLDIGAGTGVVGHALRELGHTVYGLDLSTAMLAQARARLGPVLVAADASWLPLRSGSVRQAISVWVLQMVADQGAVLSEVSRVLAPGGRYVVASGVLLPAHDPIGVQYERVWQRLDPDGRRDDRSQRLAALAPSAGLRVEYTARFEPTHYRQSPNEAADLLESGAPFYLWALSDADRAAAIGPALDRLRSLPDPDRRRERRTERELVVLRKAPVDQDPAHHHVQQGRDR